ncbi:zinc-ribbon domain-containing protein [Paenibacillus anaericanus]|uniref:Zinc-ribbon domain-containing protein n=1 Tax=Paenibacillus anaericanus TaxID=170367 RepID=A0A3S1ED41_9BACL|nr:zinc-ribbon domain-containing protein [Paenibacillus anaericanus]RUT43015.1 zinc-ribbon domain-containing protein [Paenibacillus anaericanus]
MSYCTECGEKLEDHYVYCSECGTPLDPAPANEESPLPAVQVKQTHLNWKQGSASIWPWVKHHKWVCTSVVAVIIVLIGLFETGKYVTDPNRLVSKLETALHEKDTAALASLLQVESDKVTLSATNLAPLIRYMDSDPSVTERLVTELKKQLDRDAVQMTANETEKSSADKFINLRIDGKQFMLYDKYVLEVSTYYTEVSTNYEGAKIYVNDKEAALANSSHFTAEVGPLLPGLYTFKSEYVGEYTSLQNEQTVNLTDGNNYSDLDLSLAGRYFIVESNYDDAAIYIDGKDIGALTGEKREIGPIAMDGTHKVYVAKNFPWGIIQSEEYSVTDQYITADIDPVDDIFRESIMSATQKFLKGWVESFNTLDSTKASHTSDELREALSSEVKQYIDQDFQYDLKLTKMVFDLDSIKLYSVGDGNFAADISVQNYSEQSFYYEGSTPEAPQELVGSVIYQLLYINGEWVVDSYYDNYWFNDDNTKEFINVGTSEAVI